MMGASLLSPKGRDTPSPYPEGEENKQKQSLTVKAKKIDHLATVHYFVGGPWILC